MSNRLANAWYWIQSSLWFIPCLTILAAFAMAFSTLALDRSLSDAGLESLHGIYAGGPEGARALLSAVAGSMITVTGVVFSITIVALSQASSQFGPRLLRNFMRDTGNQLVLGVFIATFVFCLLILRTIRGQTDRNLLFVPQISVSAGVLLSLVCIGFLIYFIHHVSGSIQVDDVIAKVVAETKTGNGIHPLDRVGEPWNGNTGTKGNAGTKPFPDGEPGEFQAARSGYLQSMDVGALYDFAVKQDIVMELRFRPGDFVIEGDVLIRLFPRKKFAPGAQKEINRLFVLGAHRTPLQDFQYGLNLLVEIGVRALSPSTNDPFTAMMCVDRLEELLVPLAAMPPPAPCRADQEGKPRLIGKPLTFADLLETALTPMRLFGSSNPILVCRVLELLKKAAMRCGQPETLHALSVQARLYAREEGWASVADKDRVLAQYGSFLRSIRSV